MTSSIWHKQAAREAWSWRQPKFVLVFLKPGDEDDEIVEGAGAPKRRRSHRIDDIICDLEQSSRVDQTVLF